ncbi:type II/IV secretion system protein, partial [Candidatus Saccharibacteria bacterium]|nr:type II/IV secretion system protein [Candidatus Saccharibacteria bacterium]
MSVLSDSTEKQVEHLLVQNGLLTSEQLENFRKQASRTKTPLFALLVKDQHVSDEQLTKMMAKATNTPYVNLSSAIIQPNTLALLPRETAELYMAVPIGDMENRLVVAMLDADNVQAADFLAKKIGRPIKLYTASESGIRQVLRQYSG